MDGPGVDIVLLHDVAVSLSLMLKYIYYQLDATRNSHLSHTFDSILLKRLWLTRFAHLQYFALYKGNRVARALNSTTSRQSAAFNNQRLRSGASIAQTRGKKLPELLVYDLSAAQLPPDARSTTANG
jgi:hypothetical protein